MATSDIKTGIRLPPPGRVSYEEFLNWCDEDTLAEWVQGEVLLTSPASLRHQDLVAFLATLLRAWVRKFDLGVVIPAPFQMRLPAPVDVGREPDLIFIAKRNLGRLRPTYVDGAADLVVEITSPESIGRDRGTKFLEYETAGIPEYWLIDTLRRQAEFYLLGADRHYHPAAIGPDLVFVSPSLSGLRLNTEWLWQEPVPDEIEILRSLGLLG